MEVDLYGKRCLGSKGVPAPLHIYGVIQNTTSFFLLMLVRLEILIPAHGGVAPDALSDTAGCFRVQLLL